MNAIVVRGNTDKYAFFRPIASADFDQNYEPVSPTYPGPVSSTYTIKSGDTLQSIARTVWGDADMWYLLADANGLTNANALTAGQVLTVPNKITNIHNNSSTYRVYDPGEAIGDVSPTLPDAPPPPRKKKKCGGMGGILVAIVAVVATVLTAGALAPVAGQSMWAAGIGAMSAGGFAAVAGAVVGSIASQVAGLALGVQDKFSWGAVATAGLTAGVLNTGPMKAITQSVGGALGGVLGNYGAIAARAMVGSVVGQGVGNITGSQKGFSWSSVAVAGVGAVAGAALSDQFKLTNNYGATINGTGFGADLGRAATSAGAFALSQLVVKGGKVNWMQVATDTVTNFIQNRTESTEDVEPTTRGGQLIKKFSLDVENDFTDNRFYNEMLYMESGGQLSEERRKEMVEFGLRRRGATDAEVETNLALLKDPKYDLFREAKVTEKSVVFSATDNANDGITSLTLNKIGVTAQDVVPALLSSRADSIWAIG